MSDPKGFADRLFYLYDHPEQHATDEVEVEDPPRILERYSGPVYGKEGVLLGRIEAYSDVTMVRALDRNKDAFLSSVSHELKTPITSIKGYVQLLRRRRAAEEIPEATNVAYQIIERQVVQMEELIEVLLDVARIDTGRMVLQMQDLDMRDLIDGAVKRASRAQDHQDFDVSGPQGPVSVRGDRRRLEQVFVNLMVNAAHCGRADEPVRVALSADDGRARLTVKDTGDGIATGDLPHVFDRFYRALGTSEENGMGVSLYLSKSIVEQHGGAISVETERGKGSTFTVQMPVVSGTS